MKVALAARLRSETTRTVGWIAACPTMGTRAYLNHLLYRRRKLGGSNQYQELTPFPDRHRIAPDGRAPVAGEGPRLRAGSDESLPLSASRLCLRRKTGWKIDDALSSRMCGDDYFPQGKNNCHSTPVPRSQATATVQRSALVSSLGIIRHPSSPTASLRDARNLQFFA